MSIDSFQQRRLEEYFRQNAMPEVVARRKEKGLTIKGAYEWIRSRILKSADKIDDGGEGSGCLVGDDQWCYDEMMHYFANCNEGDIYRTPEEIAEEEERQRKEKVERHEKAVKLWAKHRKRVEEWQGKTAQEIRVLIHKEKHPEDREKTPEEIAAIERAKAEARRKEEEKRQRDEKRKAVEERRRKFAAAQMDLFA